MISFKHISWVFSLFILCNVNVSYVTTQHENLTNHSGHNKKFGSSGPFLKINEVDDISTKEFFDNYVKTKAALVIRNACRSFPAFTLWSDEYLRTSSLNHDDVKLVVETSKKESRNQKVLELGLNEFLNIYKTQDLYLVNQVPDYLKADVALPQPLQCAQATQTLEQTVRLFIFIH
jgi:hypothetical protein